ncbi:MAG: hypothetical protein ACYDHP_11705 [Ferrimicrobium sp.]
MLVETFVEVPLHLGTCYQAANWVKVGRTKGRGKLDRYSKYALAVKDIYLYPLTKDFRSRLGAVSSSSSHEYAGMRARMALDKGDLGGDDHAGRT